MTLPIVLAIAAIGAANVVYLIWYFRWESRQTSGVAYYGRTLNDRRALKRRIRLFSLPALPLVRLLSLAARRQTSLPGFEFEGVYGPMKASTPEVFAKARRYAPTAQDVFVATQMRCGTTWMQQIVYEVVMHAEGKLGDHHMYALSPWIESEDSVRMEDAPLLGPSRRRVIKTHMPTKLLPYSKDAKYVYVTRNPVACFASTIDYFELMSGPFVPPKSEVLKWFCSDQMWWLSWPDHVAGWWDWAQEHPENVLFVHFEEMKKDLDGTVRKVAKLLGESLTEEQIRRIVEKSSFQWMKDNEELFEMSPPNMFSISGTYFKSGTADRDKDVSDADKQVILAHCRAKLQGRRYPGPTFYPGLADLAAK